MNTFTRWAFLISIPLALWNFFLGMVPLIEWLIALGKPEGVERTYIILMVITILLGFICLASLLPFAVGKNRSKNNALAFFTLVLLLVPTILSLLKDLIK